MVLLSLNVWDTRIVTRQILVSSGFSHYWWQLTIIFIDSFILRVTYTNIRKSLFGFFLFLWFGLSASQIISQPLLLKKILYLKLKRITSADPNTTETTKIFTEIFKVNWEFSVIGIFDAFLKTYHLPNQAFQQRLSKRIFQCRSCVVRQNYRILSNNFDKWGFWVVCLVKLAEHILHSSPVHSLALHNHPFGAKFNWFFD